MSYPLDDYDVWLTTMDPPVCHIEDWERDVEKNGDEYRWNNPTYPAARQKESEWVVYGSDKLDLSVEIGRYTKRLLLLMGEGLSFHEKHE